MPTKNPETPNLDVLLEGGSHDDGSGRRDSILLHTRLNIVRECWLELSSLKLSLSQMREEVERLRAVVGKYESTLCNRQKRRVHPDGTWTFEIDTEQFGRLYAALDHADAENWKLRAKAALADEIAEALAAGEAFETDFDMADWERRHNGLDRHAAIGEEG